MTLVQKRTLTTILIMAMSLGLYMVGRLTAVSPAQAVEPPKVENVCPVPEGKGSGTGSSTVTTSTGSTDGGGSSTENKTVTKTVNTTVTKHHNGNLVNVDNVLNNNSILNNNLNNNNIDVLSDITVSDTIDGVNGTVKTVVDIL